LSEFQDGQRYQFLIDWYPIPYTFNRKVEIRQYVLALYKNEIKEKCRELSEDKLHVYSIKEGEEPKVKKYKYYKKTLELFYGNNRLNNFYVGRCHQFIIDSSKYDPGFFDNIISEAQSIWCDDCSKWFYGDHRCSCGSRKIYLYVETLGITLDDTSISVYPQTD